MAWRRMALAALTPLLAAGLLLLVSGLESEKRGYQRGRVRVGYVASLLNGPVLVGLQEGRFEEALAGVRIESRFFSAGPQLVEAVFAGEIDIAYLGPGPAINAWVRSGGAALRIVASVSKGGSGFIVAEDWSPDSAEAFAGRVLASPQVGNTQDVALRSYLAELGLQEDGRDIRIVAASGPELHSMLVHGMLDGAWVTEPWLTRLLATGATRLWLHEEELIGAYVAVRPALLEAAPDLVTAWLQAHVALIRELNEPGPETARRLADALSTAWGQRVPSEEVASGLQRVRFHWTVSEMQLAELAARAYRLGFLGASPPDLNGLVAIDLLEQVLASDLHE